jgi:hypothetical protein
MIKARPKYPTDLYGTIYIDNIQQAAVICLIIPTTFPFDAGSRHSLSVKLHHASVNAWKLVPKSHDHHYRFQSHDQNIVVLVEGINRQTLGESASLPQYLGCKTVFDMRLRVTFLRRTTVSLQSNIAHRE